MIDKKMLIGIGVAVCVLVLWIGFSSGPKKENKEESTVVTKQEERQDPSLVEAQRLYDQAERLRDDQKFVEARKIYQKIFTEYPDFPKIEKVQREVEDLNMRLIFSDIPTEDTVIHEVVRGDTLGKLAKKYGTTIDLIKISNHLQSDVIRVGQKLRIWKAKFNIYVDKSQNILILKKGNEVLKVYDISTGKNNSTPTGTFKITSKLVDPVWFNRGVVVPPESPDNALGSRWLGFDIPGYGIHGTVEPDRIGEQVTAGCVRMRNEDVEELYSLIPLGTKVVVEN